MNKITLLITVMFCNMVIYSQTPCSPISPLDCADVAVSLPYVLNFNAPVTNSLADSNGEGTGFTMALEHSESRRPGDLAISDPNVNGYEPSLLSLSSGTLSSISQRGISYLDPPASSNNNNQVNSLGVGISNTNAPFVIKTTLLNIVTGGGGAQAGIWYGLDEDNFVKLNVNNNNIEMRVETGGLSTSSEQLQVGASASGEDVVLELLLDPNAFTVEAVYTVGTGTRTSLGTLSVPADYFTGRNIGGGDMSFAGIYNTHRSGTQFTSGFDDFSVEEQVILDSDNDILDFVLAEQTGNAVVDATAHTVSIEVAQGTDASSLVPTVTVSDNALINPQSGVAQDFSVPFDYTVTAQDGTSQQWTINVTVSNPVLCSPVSPLDCEDIVVGLPYNLDFGGSVTGTLRDGQGTGTGFTAVLEHSEARSSGDLGISNLDVNGYEPSLLNVSGGAMQLASQRGIAYLDPPASSNNNNQVNTLAVGLDNIGSSLVIKSTLLNVATGVGGAQAGIWFGYDEDNFVKFNVNNNDNMELRVESGGVSTTSDRVVQSAVGVSGQDVVLELVVDPNSLTIDAYHTIGTGQRVLFGSLSLPADYLVGRSVGAADLSFAGIYATSRNGAQFTASFDDFSVEEEATILSSENDILSFALSEQTGSAVIDVLTHSVEVIVPVGTDLSALIPEITISEEATIDPLSNTPQNFSSDVTYTVTAEDGSQQDWLIKVTSPTFCAPISPLDCSEVLVSLPINLQFNTPVAQSIIDSNGYGTGFTVVLDHSEPRRAGDLAISNPSLNGYEPSLINVSGGAVQLTSQRGIAYLDPPASSNNNNQINTLGVAIDNITSPISVKSTLLGITTGGGSAQAGIWFGYDEDNFVKLAVADNNIEFRVESGGLSTSGNSLKSDELASGEDVILELILDPNALSAESYYTIGLGERTLLGSLPVPADYFVGRSLGSVDVSMAGIFSTQRSGLQFVASFDSFIVESTTVSFDTKINFTNGSTAPPTDYFGDSGQAFATQGNGHTYGWLDAETSVPIDMTKNARNRNATGVELLKNTLIHMQYGNISTNQNSGYLPDAKWEIQVPNGTYEVIVGVGDPEAGGNSSIPAHSITAEGFNLINKYIPSGVDGSATRFTTGTGIVNVIDGRLTLEPTGGFNTKINFVEISSIGSGVKPFFTNVTPQNNSVGVIINDFQANVELIIPEGYELDNTTLAGNVNLFKLDGEQNEILVPSNSNDTGGGDAVTLTPLETLEPFTTYLFRLSNSIEVNLIGDVTDRQSFVAFESLFTTGDIDDAPVTSIDLTGIEFTQVQGGPALGEGTTGERFSSLVIGPDEKLYGSTIGDFSSDGKIFRWTIQNDGTLTDLEVLTPSLEGSPHPISGVNNNNDRMIIGLEFNPASTAENLVAYVTHNMAAITDGPEWDGKITRLSGPDLSTVQDVVIHLPRSSKDHLTNSLEFDSTGNLYINQGSNSAGGEPDAVWANRPERLLSGAVLKLELNKLSSLPLDAYTTDNISIINSASSTSTTMSDGTYNPYSVNSPLTIFSSGVRNAYDLVWHTNGWLYLPINGTAGNTVNSPNAPSTANYPLARRIDGLTSIPDVPALFGGETQKDFLYKTKGGDYHGHPNPYRGEFVLNHGGITYSNLPGQVEATYVDVVKYSENVLPDLNYTEPAYDFGKNKSPNGVIEFKSDAFGGRLSGLLMVVRFSGQDDILVMNPKINGDIGEAYNTIPGLGGLDDPLDVVEDTRTGNLYVSEYDRDNNGVPRLTLLRAAIPASIGGRIETVTNELIFEVTNNNDGENTQTLSLEISNTGNDVLNISDVSITGPFADQFNTDLPNGFNTIAPGENEVFNITYAPDLDGNNIGYQNASLTITSDGIEPIYTIGLYGLKKIGFSGSEEPALQDIVDVLGYGIDVGWDTVENNVNATPIGDEVSVNRWVRASNDSVSVIPVARYSPSGNLPFGWVINDGSIERNQVGVVGDGIVNAQTLFPSISSGSTRFDPGNSSFGIYVEESPSAIFYTEDGLNTPYPHRTRIYPRNDRNGEVIPNSYVVGFEASFNGDYQDYVFIIDNVTPFNSEASISVDKNSLEFTVSQNQSIITTTQEVTFSQQGGVTAQDVSLSTSADWVVLPEIEFGTPVRIGVDPSTLEPGDYQALVTAELPGSDSEEISVFLSVEEEIDFSFSFNFQAGSPLETSPEGYVNDVGAPYGLKNTPLGSLEYGWVEQGSLIPASTTVNARNRNNGVDIEPVHKTLTILGHRTPATFPTRDWLVNVPNGTYVVNIGVGDPGSTDSRHILDVNGITVLSFDQELDNPKGLSYFNDTALVEVTDGLLRLSLNDYGVNVKLNYLRFTEVDKSTFPPVISTEFVGDKNAPDVYRGQVSIAITAEDQTGNDNIVRLDYILDGNAVEEYDAPIVITSIGDHELQIEAEDGLGNITQETFNFTIEAASGARLAVENMTKIPGTSRGFPADDYYSFHRLGDNTDSNGKVAISHESNVMRLHNNGTANLIISDIVPSDETYFTFSILPGSNSNTSLPLTIPPGGFKDVDLVFIANLGATPDNVLLKEHLELVSNADNLGEINITLHGSYSPSPGGSREVDPQEVVDLYGLKTNLRSIVNTSGTISPPNPKPGIPVGQFPLPSNVDAGYDGDLVVSPTFVQADPNQPVRAFSFATYAGGPSNIRFIRPNSTTVVGGISFSANTNWYNTILSRNNSGVISNDSNSSINEPFRVVIAGRTSAGGTNTSGSNPQMLYVRLYKVRDHEGQIIPNEYIGMQDFSGGGGCGPCDWNDNMVYFMNIRPENLSSAPASTEFSVLADDAFEIKSSSYLDSGYPGNEFQYTALLNGVNPLPTWIIFDNKKGAFSGVPPVSSTDTDYNVEVSAIDLNGTVVNTTVILKVVDEIVSDLPWVESFEGLNDGAMVDSGDTEWTSTRSNGLFEVQNGRFMVNGSGGTGTWSSEVISIDGEVNISIDVDDDANFEKENSDFIRAFYVVDGGNPIQFGSLVNDISAQTFSVTGISGSTIQVVVESSVSFTNEAYFFDNISITKPPVAFRASLNDFEGPNDNYFSEMKLYPNPASTTVWLEWDSSIELSEIILFDQAGRIIDAISGKVLEGNRSYLMNVSGLNNGLYFVRIVNQDGSVTIKKLLINK